MTPEQKERPAVGEYVHVNPPTVRAVRLTPDTVLAVLDFGRADLTYRHMGNLSGVPCPAFDVKQGDISWGLYPGWWLYRDPNGKLDVTTHDLFQQRYRPLVEEPSPAVAFMQGVVDTAVEALVGGGLTEEQARGAVASSIKTLVQTVFNPPFEFPKGLNFMEPLAAALHTNTAALKEAQFQHETVVEFGESEGTPEQAPQLDRPLLIAPDLQTAQRYLNTLGEKRADYRLIFTPEDLDGVTASRAVYVTGGSEPLNGALMPLLKERIDRGELKETEHLALPPLPEPEEDPTLPPEAPPITPQTEVSEGWEFANVFGLPPGVFSGYAKRQQAERFRAQLQNDPEVDPLADLKARFQSQDPVFIVAPSRYAEDHAINALRLSRMACHFLRTPNDLRGIRVACHFLRTPNDLRGIRGDILVVNHSYLPGEMMEALAEARGRLGVYLNHYTTDRRPQAPREEEVEPAAPADKPYLIVASSPQEAVAYAEAHGLTPDSYTAATAAWQIKGLRGRVLNVVNRARLPQGMAATLTYHEDMGHIMVLDKNWTPGDALPEKVAIVGEAGEQVTPPSGTVSGRAGVIVDDYQGHHAAVKLNPERGVQNSTVVNPANVVSGHIGVDVAVPGSDQTIATVQPMTVGPETPRWPARPVTASSVRSGDRVNYALTKLEAEALGTNVYSGEVCRAIVTHVHPSGSLDLLVLVGGLQGTRTVVNVPRAPRGVTYDRGTWWLDVEDIWEAAP